MPNVPALRDVGGGALFDWPDEIRAYLFDQHFSGEKNKAPTSVKLTDKALQALSLMLIDLRIKGGQPWIQNQSDALSAGLWLLLALYNHYTDPPPAELKVLMLLEQMEGHARTQDRMALMVDNIVILASKMVVRLTNDPDGEDELITYCHQLIGRLNQLDGYWRAKAKRAIREDRQLYQAVKKVGLEDKLD